MSLVTRCTACGTLFKVVADQLKISDGWVRCGQCATVFDAQANLVNAAVDEPLAPAKNQTFSESQMPASAELAQQTQKPGFFHGVPSQDSQAADSLPAVSDDIDSEIQSFRASKLRDLSLLPPEIEPAQSTSQETDDSLISSPISVLPGSEEPTTFIPASKLDSVLPSEPLSGLGDSMPLSTPMATPSFVKQAQRAQRWRSPWMRVGLSLVCCILLVVFVAQISLHDKDRLAAQWPQTKPWLDQLCQHAGCTVQAYRRIDAIAVDASSFNRISKNNAQPETSSQSYRLAVTLKNTSTLPVAMPHVELSLQDSQDQSILRRVLSPADLGSSLAALAPAQDVAGALTLQIDTAQLAGSRIQGYRVMAFYP